MTDETAYGFGWGPLIVQRTAVLPGDRYVLTVMTTAGQELDIYCSPTGRSLRVWRKGKGELVAQAKAEAPKQAAASEVTERSPD